MQLEKYRGPITNRGLTTSFNRRDGIDSMGNLELLRLTLPELVGKKILNVGIGGGKALEHALELGLDCYGLDILPSIDVTGLDLMKRAVVEEQLHEFERVRALYPERVKAVDFCASEIPYTANEFDVVFSAVALPDYARSEREAALSILNMMKLAQEKVIFHCGWNPIVSQSGLVTLGTVPGLFMFRMKDFLDGVASKTGISYDLIPSPDSRTNSLTSILTIHTTDKDNQALQLAYSEFV